MAIFFMTVLALKHIEAFVFQHNIDRERDVENVQTEDDKGPAGIRENMENGK